MDAKEAVGQCMVVRTVLTDGAFLCRSAHIKI